MYIYHEQNQEAMVPYGRRHSQEYSPPKEEEEIDEVEEENVKDGNILTVHFAQSPQVYTRPEHTTTMYRERQSTKQGLFMTKPGDP